MGNLYDKELSKPFEESFANPGAIYRDTPFWSWNSKLEQAQLNRQIEVFSKMGMGGYHMHSRTGMATEYLSEEFMDRVGDCVEEAKKHNMLAWLYDEDRWPSGAAGGYVTRNPKFRARHLEIHFKPLETPPDLNNDNSGRLLSAYLVRLDDDGLLAEYRQCPEDEFVPEGFFKIYCYLVLASKSHWYNDQTYVDTLNPDAVREFVKITHEKYLSKVGDDFNTTIPAIFTDEPQFTRKVDLTFAREQKVLSMPYTDDFDDSYRQTYGAEFLPTVPELVWNLPGGRYSQARYRYHDHVTERFVNGFFKVVSDWCQEHNLRNTGHLMAECDLFSQILYLGEAMRNYRSFIIPGIDMLYDTTEYATAKQAQSVSRQDGRGALLSELDGVTDWDFNFMGHKGHGDWQAALGVTVRVPHLSWVSMAGEAKRDYPASISYQSPWHEKYGIIADHFGRVNAAMTRGEAVVHVAVVHPIESYWLFWGPADQSMSARTQAEENFANIVNWLLHGLIDFDFVSESLLPGQGAHVEGKELVVGQMRYRSIIVPPTVTLRKSTLDILESFQAAGGDVIFAGDVATHCDALPSDRPAEIASKCRRIMFSQDAILKALEDSRELKIVDSAVGLYATSQMNLLYQMREEADGTRYIFIVRHERYGMVQSPYRVMLKGNWQLDYLDTSNGAITPIEARHERGWTVLETEIYPHGHLLLRMKPSDASVGVPIPRYPVKGSDLEKATVARVEGWDLSYTLDEPNVLMLDQAKWRVDDGEWQPREEILRLDNKARNLMGIGDKSGNIVQPWVYPVSDKVHGKLAMLFEIECECPVEGAFLAAEQPEKSKFTLDGRSLEFTDCGWWTDECVRKSPLPKLDAGKHLLIVERNYMDDTNIERLYVLGDFGVEVRGSKSVIVPMSKYLHWGDLTTQGLPFYGGNVTYHANFTLANDVADAAIRFPSRQNDIYKDCCGTQAAKEIDFASFRGTLVSVSVDGRETGDIAFSPYQLKLGPLSAGRHEISFKLYGSRINCFGAVHLTGRIFWVGPNAWRTNGDGFTYDYTIVSFGIFKSPMLLSL